MLCKTRREALLPVDIRCDIPHGSCLGFRDDEGEVAERAFEGDVGELPILNTLEEEADDRYELAAAEVVATSARSAVAPGLVEGGRVRNELPQGVDRVHHIECLSVGCDLERSPPHETGVVSEGVGEEIDLDGCPSVWRECPRLTGAAYIPKCEGGDAIAEDVFSEAIEQEIRDEDCRG